MYLLWMRDQFDLWLNYFIIKLVVLIWLKWHLSGTLGFHDVTKNLSEPIIFDKDEALSIADLRPVWHSFNYHEFWLLQVLCEEFGK